MLPFIIIVLTTWLKLPENSKTIIFQDIYKNILFLKIGIVNT